MSFETPRPTPEHFLSMIRDSQRGRLKIYLGFAPGVGKTYEMLQEGQRLKRQGVDVVIGIVETHGRAETAALIGDLELIPRRRIEYRGVVLEELNLDEVLRRRPTVVMVDELAHTNAPGSKHAKRYLDVEEMLAQGLHVITTMNIQHLESLYDTVEKFTGVRVKERVPDYVLSQAQQVVNVDLPAEDLQERMRVGKIYPMDRAERAIGSFFTDDNLNQLREIALEQVAHILDRRRQERDGATRPNTSERVMVCLSLRSPNAPRLLRKGARLADRFGAPWYAVYVQTPAERNEKVDAASQRRLADALTLARQLGGITFEFKGTEIGAAVAEFVREYGITHIVLGRSRRSWFQRRVGTSIVDRLFSAVAGTDILIVDTTP